MNSRPYRASRLSGSKCASPRCQGDEAASLPAISEAEFTCEATCRVDCGAGEVQADHPGARRGGRVGWMWWLSWISFPPLLRPNFALFLAQVIDIVCIAGVGLSTQ